MIEELGLRERKKRQTGRALWEAAMALFVERGFDNVSVAEIAAAVNVSKMTVFNYFGTKEDLVLGPMEEHADEPARTVRERASGESAVGALRRQFLAALSTFDPATGLNDYPEILNVQRLVRTTPSLAQRILAFRASTEELLAAELVEQTGERDLTPRLAAAQIIGVRATLVTENSGRLLAGESAVDVLPDAIADAEHAFDLLERGLGGYCRRA